MSIHSLVRMPTTFQRILIVMAVLVVSLSFRAPPVFADVIPVPSDESTIAAAISVASNLDTILVADAHVESGTITVSKKLLIQAESGGLVKVTGTITVGSVDVTLCGLTAEAGIKGEDDNLIIEDCIITGGTSFGDGGVVVNAGSGIEIRRTRFEGMTVGITGDVRLDSNCITFPFQDITVEDCVFLNVDNAINLGCSNTPPPGDGYGTISGCVFDTCDVVLQGFYGEGSTSFTNNIVRDCEDVFEEECPNTFQYNVLYSNTTVGCTVGSNNTTDDPLFCGSKEGTSEYTLRMDSPAIAENNSWDEDIGPFGVECAFGTLARDTEVAAGKEVLVLEDVTVPSGKTLTIGENVIFSFDEDDNSSSGQDDEENELIVSGTLDVNGTNGNEVEFVSAETSPGEAEWFGLRVSAGTTNIDNAIVKHAENGISIEGGSSYVDSVSFANNLSYDVVIQSTSVDTSEITNCTFTVFTGSGIKVASDDVLIQDNIIACADTTNYGIEIGSDVSNVLHPQIIGNTIKDFTNGSGIYVPAESPHIEKNTIKDGKWGIYLTGGAAKIGDASDSSSDNTITGNTRGIYSNCSGPGSCPTCSGFAPVVRQSTISSNTTGVYVSKRGFIDLGTSSDNGKNTLTNNTAYCVRNASNCDTISLVGNWYGAHPPIVCWTGNVDVTSPLTSAPASNWGLGIERLDSPKGPLAVQALWPNPVQSSATIQFRAEEGVRHVEVQIFDVAGRLVWQQSHPVSVAGVHELVWDGKDRRGRQVKDGIYFLRLTTDDQFQQTARLLVAR